MNLDLLPIGWVHFIASLLALAIAPLVLMQAKGTAIHKRNGRIYVVAILVTSTTALGIYRLGFFFFAHWFAVASLATTAIAFAAVFFKRPRRGWVHIHLTFMIASVYILFGGLTNELFLRVAVLRQMTHGLGSPIVQRTQLSLQILFAVLIVYFNIREWRRRASSIAPGDGDAVAVDQPGAAAGR